MDHHQSHDDAGYRLASDRTVLPAAEEIAWEFVVVGPHGRPASYETHHEKDLHLIVVRDDLSTFLHVHPTRRADGTWTVGLELPVPGAYTAFADVAPDDSGPMTLRLPLEVGGDAGADVAHQPSRRADVDAYRVDLHGEVAAGEASDIEFAVTRGGRPVTPDPYLGAAGHLVAIRAGDLAYLHVHPMEGGPAGTIRFMMHAPGPGLYRLFLQFLHGGEVRTADFTVDVAGPGSAGA